MQPVTLKFPDGWECFVSDLGPRRVEQREDREKDGTLVGRYSALCFYRHNKEYLNHGCEDDITLSDLNRALKEAYEIECWNRAVIAGHGIMLPTTAKEDEPRSFQLMRESLKPPFVTVTHREGEK